MGNVHEFVSRSHLSLFNQPLRPTQPCHPSWVGKTSTGAKTGKVTAGYGRALSVCSLLAQDLGNGEENCTIVAEL